MHVFREPADVDEVGVERVADPLREFIVPLVRLVLEGFDQLDVAERSPRYSPSVTSAQVSTVLLFKNAITLGSRSAGRSWPSTAVATMASQ